ncbi:MULTISPECIES: HtaA domain-containing protein [unclassified Frankia]|uniref:HtaA domain-containing protein n=1 Tax=unclassified Frankia TaxID=2632575 RepID=UPI0020245FEE
MSAAEPLLGLRWGIKATFLTYIARMPDGQGSASDGARSVENDEFVFEPDPSATAPEGVDGFWAFRGDVRFQGHFGLLYVRIADPHVVLRGTQAELNVVDPSEPGTKPRIPLVRFVPRPGAAPSGLRTWEAEDVRLLAEGAGLFNNVYSMGEPFEPLTITLPASPQAG